MRRIPTTRTAIVGVVLAFGAVLLLFSSSLAAVAAAQDDDNADAGVVPVLQTSGLIDPILADFITDGIDKAEGEGARALVLQVNSRGSVLGADELAELAEAIDTAEIPIAVWVGPSGARALGETAQLVALVDRVGVAPGSRLGDTGEQVLDTERFGQLYGDNAGLVRNDTIGHEVALSSGIAAAEAPTVGDFIVSLVDLGVEASAVDDRTQLDTVVRFERLSLASQLLHTVSSPAVAYLLFAIGIALFIFEFYTAGVGVAGIVGAVMFLLGTYGLVALPVRLWAVAVLVLAMLAFSVDVQTGVPRFWTAVGGALFIVGTLTLYKDGVSMSWIPMLVGCVGIGLMMLTGMPTMVRTRFSTPTIGREWMLGEMGDAVEAIDPDGVVRMRDSLWKARTNRATPIAVGEPVRVVAVEGLWLEVEPEEGAARDYRERG